MSRERFEAIFPLSPPQQGVFLEALAAGAEGLFVEQSVGTIRGPLDVPALERAWQAVVDCHPMLRTAFAGKGLSTPVQLVHRRVDAPVTALDWRGAPAEEQEARLEELLARDRREGFELHRAPLMRLALIRTAEEERTLVWTHHHILMDGWCISLVLSDLFAAYRAAARGQRVELVAGRPYLDFVRWIKAQDRSAAQAFWRERLRGFQRPTPLGARCETAPSEGGAAHADHTVRLPAVRLGALRVAARRQRVTLATLVQAAWAVQLARYAGTSDVVFGLTVSGRPAELEGVSAMLGLFLATIPRRVVIDPAAPLGELVAALQRQQEEQQAFEVHGGGQIHEWSEVPGSAPLYESLLVYENYPVDRGVAEVDGISLDLGGARTIGARTRTPLAILVTPGDGLEIQIVHDTSRIAAADAERIAAHMDALLKRMADDAAIPVSALMETIPAAEIPRVAPAPWEARLAEGGAVAQEEAPRSPLEETVANVFCAALGRPRIGRGESFFELGGHSLLATQALARLGDALGRRLPLRLLFEHPTPEGLAAAIEAARDPQDGTRPPPITPAPRGEPIPLSFNQERVWFLDRLGGKNVAAYVEQGAVRLTGRLDVPALERSLCALVERHEALRTTFVATAGQPAQIVHPPSGAALRPVDLSPIAEELRGEELERRAAEDASRPFDLTRGPLFRAALYRLSEAEHALVLTIHHIITDGWSHAIFFQELASLYRAFSKGLPSPLPPPPLQLADHAAWQRRWLAGPVLEAEIERCAARLAGAPPRSSIDPDRAPLAPKTGRGASLSRQVPRATRDALHAIACREGATLFMVVLAALDLALHRSTGQTDLLVGTPVAGRGHELERVFGFFVSTAVIRVSLEGRLTFPQLLARVREASLAAYAQQDAPFDRVVERLRPERSASHNPLFQVFINMLSHPEVALALDDLRVEELPLSRAASMFDLTLYVTDSDDGLRLSLVYDSDLFSAPRMEALAAQLETLLAEIAGRPEADIASYALEAGGAPAARLVTHDEGNVLDALREQVTRAPDRAAIVSREGTFTYRELAAQADRLAEHLRRGGVRRGDVVAVLGHRSASLVWALLGILGAGAAFAILDPDHPSPRLLGCLEVAAPAAWIALQEAGPLPPALEAAVAKIPCRVALPPLSQADSAALLPALVDGPRPALAGPDDAAYVAFTSGTTGAPKGIVGTHRPVVHFLRWYARTFGIREADRFAMLSGLGHDPLLRDVFAPLCSGASLHVPAAVDMSSGEALLRWLDAGAITVMHITPALGQALAAGEGGGADRRAPRSLRCVFFGGAALTLTLALKVQRLLPSAMCVNFYGATETPQAVAYHVIKGDEGAVVPIGRGIDDVEIRVEGSAGRLAAAYELGEVCVRTPYLAAGYLGDVGPGGFGTIAAAGQCGPPERVYRTGDLGRRLADGSIVVVGRRDRQVKVRGYRVELAEIEHHLAAHPDVEQAAVIARPVRGDERDAELVAYWVGARAEADALRAHLSARLPRYMVPAWLVRVDALPRTPNGKLDVRSLPDPSPRSEAAPPRIAPRNDLERTLCALFGEALGREDVGVRDDFFSLGGHSLKAMQLMSRARGALGVELPLRALFDLRTVEALAADLALRAPAALLPPVTRAEPADDHPLSHAQRRLWMLDRLHASGAAYHMNDALLIEGDLDRGALDAAFDAVVQRHEALRTVFVEVDGEPRQRVLERARFRCSFVDLRGELDPRGRALALAAEEASRPFDLAAGPLLRVALLALEDRAHVLVFSVHHIVADAWSLEILARDLLDAYSSASAGRAPELPPLRSQYRDYAAWQARLLEGDAARAHRDHWLRALAGPIEPLNLPTDLPRPAVRGYEGAVWTHRFEGRGAALRELGERHGASLFMVLVALVKVLLHRYTGQRDVIVGAPIAGRDRVELEEPIGCFVNMLVLRDRIDPDAPLSALLAQVKATATGAYSHGVYPFDRLVEDLRATRDPSRSPLFDVAVVLQQAERSELTIPGLRISPFEQPARSSKFDLRFVFEERGGDLSLVLEYRTDLFREARMRRAVGHLGALIEAALKDPERPIGELDLLPEDERRLVVEAFNATRADHPHDRTIIDLFEAQAAATPDAVAVVAGAVTLTYAELRAQARALAARLRRAHGVGPGDLVALMLDRDEQIIVAMLAALAAGGAYVPLDPEYPAERLRHMLAASGCRVIVSQDRHRALLDACLPEGERPAILDVRADRDRDADGDLPALAAPDDAAYVIFTSGSTGRPKGCVVTNRNAVRLFKNDLFPFEFGPSDVWIAAHSFCFDFTVWEMYGALLFGGRVVVPPRERVRDVAAFHALIREHEVTVLNQTPAAFYALIEVERTSATHDLDRHLRAVIFGGDRLEPAHLAPWARLYPLDRVQLVNMYGITETTVHVTYGPLTEAHIFQADGRSPIGVPLPETRVYVCDARMSPQPIGVVGELYVGGTGVCRGYLGQPGLTARRFVPDPFGGGGRLYRSGDLGRWNEDGTLEHLGRNDAQVQIRGHRVELGEIEASLALHESVKEAVVLAREVSDPAGGPGASDVRLVAYVVPAEGRRIELAELRRALGQRLPGYMIPGELVLLPAMPLTSNGKVDRRALSSLSSAPRAPEPAISSGPVRPNVPVKADLVETIRSIWRGVLGAQDVGLDDNFFDVGGHSLLLFRVARRLEQELGAPVKVVDLFRFPTVRALADLLDPSRAAGSSSPLLTAPRAAEDRAIAIIGMSGRFPGAPDIEGFWRNLCDGVESIQRFTDEELAAAGVRPEVYRDPAYVKARPTLADADKFDAAFFGMTPREAEVTDPQHRVFLEAAFHALEDAGYAPSAYPGRIAVFAGTSGSSYLLNNVVPNRERLEAMGDYPLIIGNDKDYLSTRVAYKLDLRGPAVSLGAACSTSLVAVDWACQALREGKADMALAGGVSIKVPQIEGYTHHVGGILSPDGHCRAFDAAANGTIGGSGAAVVVLKPYANALADGDHIYAVIRGTATNNDGSAKIGFTAPSAEGQARVITAALADAGVDPDTIGYVEAHGTGTSLGDPIEMSALTRAFRGANESSLREERCAVGSVKTNIGHLDAAAGVTGLVKAALALDRGKIPPSLHFERPNPALELEESPFRVAATLTDWPRSDSLPRRAGVSSFGLGGTNAHVVLEEAPAAPPSPAVTAPQLLVLSAKTPAALDARAADLAAHLRAHPEISLADAAYTLQVGREALSHRRALVCGDAAEAALALETSAPRGMESVVGERPPRVALLFPGQGAQYIGMGRDLYASEPGFREDIDRCVTILREATGIDMGPLFHPDQRDEQLQERLLEESGSSHPALFAVELGLARLWQRWGVQPDAMIGNSMGEYTAACLAGVMDLEHAIALVSARGRLIEGLPPGGMLAVPMSEEALRPLLGADLDLAVINGPEQCVVSGQEPAIASLEALLGERGVTARRVRALHAFHSRWVEPMVEAFNALVARVPLRPPSIRYISNVTGTWITDAEATDPLYYGRHLRSTVRFEEGIATLSQDPDRVFLEVGPGDTLTRVLQQRAARAGGRGAAAFTSLRSRRGGLPDERHMRETLGRLWLAGAAVDFTALHGEPRRRVSLPVYRFEKTSHWLEPPGAALPARRPASGLDVRREVASWFHVPSFRRVPAPIAPASAAEQRAVWLLFADELGAAQALSAHLHASGHRVITVHAGDTFQSGGDGSFTISPAEPAHYTELLRALDSLIDGAPIRVAHLWLLGGNASGGGEEAETSRDRGYYSLVYLGQALQSARRDEDVHIAVVASGLCDVTGQDTVSPDRALVLGPLRVLPQEVPGISCRAIDVALSPRDTNGARAASMEALAQRLWTELRSPADGSLIALRGPARWVHGHEPLRLDSPADGRGAREAMTWLITGGLGGVGLLLAEQLARTTRANLVLVGRSPAPAGSEKQDRLDEIRALAGGLLIAVADVGDRVRMAEVVAEARARFGKIHGVFHAAGDTREGRLSMPLAAIDRAASIAQLHARINGIHVLDEVLAGEPIERALVISSNAAVLGGIGLAVYAAACNYIDAHAQLPGAPRRLPWLSTNWDGWPTPRALARLEQERSSIDQYAMTLAECESAVARLLACGMTGQIIVSAGDLDARLGRWIRLERPRRPSLKEAVERPESGARPRSRAGGAPADETEAALIGLFEELIGVTDIGVTDNFFELGGDSLLGTQLLSRVRRSFEIELAVQTLFERPTAKGLAEVVRELTRLRGRLTAKVTAPLGEAEEEGEI